jgi:hypothetical protein
MRSLTLLYHGRLFHCSMTQFFREQAVHKVHNEVARGGKEAPLLFPHGVNAC